MADPGEICAAAQGLLEALEDMHWMDQATACLLAAAKAAGDSISEEEFMAACRNAWRIVVIPPQAPEEPN